MAFFNRPFNGLLLPSPLLGCFPMTLLHKAGWGGLAILCAIAFAHVVGFLNPHEKVNGLMARCRGLVFLRSGLSVLRKIFSCGESWNWTTTAAHQRIAWKTGPIFIQPTNIFSSAIILPPLPEQAHCWVQCSHHNLVFFQDFLWIVIGAVLSRSGTRFYYSRGLHASKWAFASRNCPC